MAGSTDILIVGGLAIAVGALIMYPGLLDQITINPATGQPWFGSGGEFYDPCAIDPNSVECQEYYYGTGGGGDFLVSDNLTPTGLCKSRYNGKCSSECKNDKYSVRCQDCLTWCGGGQGQAPGMCYSAGKDKSVPCGSTSNTCNTASNGRNMCKCGSNVRGNKVRDDRLFQMGPGRTCSVCTQYCKTGSVPKQLNYGSTTVPPSAQPTSYPKTISANCKQIGARSYRWTSSGKSRDATVSAGTSANNGCMAARSAWLKAYSSSGGGSSGGGSSGGSSGGSTSITSTLCKCGSARAVHVRGICNNCKSSCRSRCGNCSPQCLGTKTNVAYYEPEPYFYNEDPPSEYYFANVAVSV